jgi:phage shock protein A
MGEPILKRMQRVVSAGLESAADAAERLNGSGMMRHAIRELDQAIDKLRKQLDSAEASALQADSEQARIRDQVNELGRDARFAMDKGREDLAQAAVSRQLDFEEEARQLKQSQVEAAREAVQFRASLTELRARKDDMERDYAAFEKARREAQTLGKDPKTELKVKRAEAAFERARAAMKCAPNVAHVTSTEGYDELKVVQREDAIEQRMAALRSGPAGKVKRNRPAKA